MGAIYDKAKSTYRDFKTEGVESSGKYEPQKPDIRNLFSAIDIAVYAAQAGIRTVATTANRDTFYSDVGNQGALVYVNNNNGADDDPENGVYEYVDGEPRIATGFYQGVASVVQPLLDQAQETVDSISGLSADIAGSKKQTDKIDLFGGLVDEEDTPWPAGQPLLAAAHKQRIMPIIGTDRRLVAFGLDLRDSETAAPDAEDTGDITAVREVDAVTGKVVGAYNPDGTRWFVPDAQTLQYIAEQIGSGGSAVTWRGAGATDIAGSTSLWRATMSDDLGWTGRVKQLPGGGYSTAVADVLPLVALHYYGQSNAGRGGSAVSVLTNADLPHHVLAFDAGQAQYGTDAFDPATATDFVAASDTAGLAPHPAIASGFASALLDRRFGTIDRAYLTRTDWYGGEPLTTFVKGEQTYDNLIGSITKANEIATSYGLFYRPVIVFVQGESGPTDRAAYGAMFDGLIDDLRTDIAAITRKTPPLIFFQINTGDNVTGAFAKPVKLAQLDVAKARAGTDVVLAGPMYQCPFAETPVNEVIHPGAPGRAIYGEVASLVERIVAREGTFNPLMIAAVTRTGATIIVDFELPPGAKSIDIDDDWIGAAVTTPNLGFSYADNGGVITIDSAEISGPAQATITLSADPTGNSDITLRYAIDEADTTDDNWSDARGLIYASSGIASTLAELPELAGQIPADIRHYCVASEETLS